MFKNWNIHSERYTIKAKVRRWLHERFTTNYGEYGDGVPGYAGWHELRWFGVTAFVRREIEGDDFAEGSLQYRW